MGKWNGKERRREKGCGGIDRSNQELAQKLKKFEEEDDYKLGNRLGLSEETFVWYEYLKKYRGFAGSLADFIDMAVKDAFRLRGYEFKREETWGSDGKLKTSFVIVSPKE